MQKKHHWTEALNLTVLVGALGYFVDMFDITIFGVVRVASLKGIGITDPKAMLDAGLFIFNWGMVGMMIGGVIWGVLADKKGRLSVLFGSILLYSLGNIVNAFVTDVHGYALCRFFTGIGLAGELGAAITLVSESLPSDLRGIGTTIVATLGLLGAVAASFIGQHLQWQTAFVLGGVMGLLLLVTRFQLRESGMFREQKHTVSRGDLRLLLKPHRLGRYLLCIGLGVPIYFITGILFTFSPEIAGALGVNGTVTAGNTLLFGSIGLALGDLVSGVLSQVLRSRKKAVAISLAVAISSAGVYLLGRGLSAHFVYALCFFLGLAAGYWAVLVTMAAEQFGTNIRATVASTVPNFVRGSAVICTLTFTYLKGHLSVPHAALAVGAVWFLTSSVSLLFLKETFGSVLDFEET